MVEEVRKKTGIELETDDVYMSTRSGDFIHTLVNKSRGEGVVELEYDAVSLKKNYGYGIVMSIFCYYIYPRPHTGYL